jgi:hypothetical protein
VAWAIGPSVTTSSQLIFPSKTNWFFWNLFEFSGAEMGKIWNSFVQFTILIE